MKNCFVSRQKMGLALLIFCHLLPLFCGFSIDNLSAIRGKSEGKNEFLIKNKTTNQKEGQQDPNVIFPMVTTPLGQLRGKAEKSRMGRWFYSFRGIPYATSQRFQFSVPTEPWSGLFDARENGPVCPQLSLITGQPEGVEDCLVLNVHFPHHDRCQNEGGPAGKLPVFFFIHGGGYLLLNGAMHNPAFFMDECVLYEPFVSINYRLGALGFLTTNDGVIEGNLGMKDQVLALQWVQRYISHFRGDPNLVTLIGNSAGGSAVSHHVTSPMSAGLFHRAIAISGSVMTPWSVTENPSFYANELGVKLNCPVESSTLLKNCLETRNILEIVSNQDNGDIIPFGPVVEAGGASTDPFLTEHPALLYKSGNFNQVPLVTGFVQDEGIYLLAGPILSNSADVADLNANFSTRAPRMFNYNELGLDDSQKDEISRQIRQFYFADEPIGLETRQNLVDLCSDRWFVQGAFETAEIHSKFAPTFTYVMTYKGGATFATPYGYEVPVATHGDEMQYNFGDVLGDNPPGKKSRPLAVTPSSPGSDQFNFSIDFIQHWLAFAKTGNPSLPSKPWNATSGRSNSVWHQLDLVEGDFENYLNDRRTFWENLNLYDLEFGFQK